VHRSSLECRQDREAHVAASNGAAAWAMSEEPMQAVEVVVADAVAPSSTVTE
jgi:hypothetical protein